MFFWKKPQKPTLNRSVVEIEYFINDVMFLDLEQSESTPNYKDFLSIYIDGFRRNLHYNS